VSRETEVAARYQPATEQTAEAPENNNLLITRKNKFGYYQDGATPWVDTTATPLTKRA
jgi:hypothetical protein